ncbi:MAG: HIT domain-containing protein [Desulfobacteraceae bacterium]|jgi:diadenosine tetraphosphate (Ap4A) HIT family hydrolase
MTIENNDFKCRECAFRLYLPIKRLNVATLGLYDDNRYPGRCILVYHEHIEFFEDLEDHELFEFIKDIQHASKVIKKAVNAKRINYAILGNAESHLHAHIIPRKPDKEPIPNQAPWAHPEKSSPLSQEKRSKIIESIGAIFEKQRSLI